ncbi:MAG: hypothetical protein H6983_12825 [Ectothiorhodospiraceae bacterium]|nr:hypothetical protein [Chromatiales bacterium]MCP5155047.1 hypothetical protein [Ectothiorhodospiraceae bacterium]
MSGPAAQRGFTLAGAVFLLTVIATLGVYTASVGVVAHDTVRLSVAGERAHFAAHAGLEWAIHDVVANGAAGLGCGGAAVSFTLTGGALADHDVSIACTASAVTEGARSYTVYTLTAIGSRGTPGDADHASRTLVATVTD